MNDERRREIEDLFDAMLDLPEAERSEALEARCGADAELLAEVRAMLAAHELAERIFPDRMPGLPASPGGDERIGHYRIVREIGRGGMGVVYLAERADGQFEQRVAIKLIHSRAADDMLYRRFLVERQILAGLDHPNIARLLDGGVTEDGRPYLVLQYVDGIPITEYCDRNRLTIEDRLALFEEVCATVQYAHRNLVIHRDLKPGNILVTSGGEVRLLDFGIAKLVEPEQTPGAAPVTRAEFRLMTPGYASPEQVRGDPLSTASDLYSLGVILYELLTGSSPYTRAPQSTAELFEIVCNEDPERPSGRVTRTERSEAAGDRVTPQGAITTGSTGSGAEMETTGSTAITPADRAELRAMTPDRLPRRLRGDLDSIVLMALRKEPASRYASVDLLRQDIRRHLEGFPVLAHQGSRRYRVGRFVRRHRVETAAAVIVALSLVTGTATATWQAVVAGREQERAEAERAKAEEVASFLEGLFAAVDPYALSSERLDTLRVRDLLSRGADRVRTGLADQPVVQAQMFDVVGRVYRSLGLYQDAQPLLEDALATRRAVLGPQHVDVAASLVHLGTLYTETGALVDAERVLREALEINRTVRARGDPEVAANLNALANALRERGWYGEAERHHLSAIELLTVAEAGESPQLAEALTDLVATLEAAGDHEAAAERAREVVALHRGLYGSEHPRLALALRELGLLLQRLGSYAEAESLFQESYGITLASIGPEHPRTADLLNRLASIRRWLGDFETADSLYRESIALSRRLYGDRHVEVAYNLNNFASLLRDKRQYDEAIPLHEEAIDIARERLGTEHANYWVLYGNLAMTLTVRGDCAVAEPMHRDAIAGMRRAIPRDLVRAPLQESWLGECLVQLERHEEAEPLLLESYRALSDRGTPDEFARETAGRIVGLYESWGRREEADRWRELTR